MNTDRDNFHDWARDKPETAFSALQNLEGRRHREEPTIRWGRLAVFILLGVALLIFFKLATT